MGEDTAHTRAQVLYYIAENLIQRRDEIAARLAQVVGEEQASTEVELSIERIFSYAAWADKYDGAVHNPPMRNVTLAMNEAIGAIGIICPTEAPLLGFLSLVLPAIAVGNTVVAVPSETLRHRSSATSTRSSTPAICPAVSSTSSPAAQPNSPRPSPSTTTSTPSGASATRRMPPS